MEYNSPYGNPDPNAGYVDRDTPAGIKGSVPPAAAIEMPQREIVKVIEAAGLIPTNTDPTQLLQAIGGLISPATGGGGDANFVLMTQARSRLPIYPEALTADGKLPVTAPATGTVRLTAGYSFLHRGLYPVTTVETDFSTTASKTYHLRWLKDTGFALKDVADSGYNSGGLAETDAAFDSKYDDMLIARVVTNAGNGATILSLVNKHDVRLRGAELNAKGALTGYGFEDNVAPSAISQYTTVAVNLARTPDVMLSAANDVNIKDSVGDQVSFGARALSRYSLAVWGQGDIDMWTGWVARC